jgi:phosphomannomutase/phosphoglucomutase
VESPEDEKFDLVERAAVHFAARYPVNTIDGVRITFPKGWGLLRASNTQPVLVMRFEATDPQSRDEYRREVESWLDGQKLASAAEKTGSGVEKSVSGRR